MTFSQILRGTTSGSLNILTTDCTSGTYFVSLQYGKEVKTKQLVVRH
ncbi:MAG: T9SS type A sorting domain-containing protein [Saprospiraceae bacterium]|nr:T9SS type A sorting domain-containing protein [Saprospiraceae bacterium]